MRNLDVPWARCGPARVVRETILQFVLAPLIDLYIRPRVVGRDLFSTLRIRSSSWPTTPATSTRR